MPSTASSNGKRQSGSLRAGLLTRVAADGASVPARLPPLIGAGGFLPSGGREARGAGVPWAEPTATGHSTSRRTSLEPTAEELKISARLLLHIGSQPRVPPGETAPDSLTQAGMAQALGSSQAAVSNALRRLVDGGALREARGHVEGARRRLKVYQLTDLGEDLARHIRSEPGY